MYRLWILVASRGSNVDPQLVHRFRVFVATIGSPPFLLLERLVVAKGNVGPRLIRQAGALIEGSGPRSFPRRSILVVVSGNGSRSIHRVCILIAASGPLSFHRLSRLVAASGNGPYSIHRVGILVATFGDVQISKVWKMEEPYSVRLASAGEDFFGCTDRWPTFIVGRRVHIHVQLGFG